MRSHARSKRRSTPPRSLPRRCIRSRGEQDGPPAGVILGAGRIDPLRTTLVLSVRGRLTIPAELRRALAIEEGGELIAEATPQGLLLRPVLAFAVDASEAPDASRVGTTPLARRTVKRTTH